MVQKTNSFVQEVLEKQCLIVSRTVNYYKRRVDVVSFVRLLPYYNCAIIVDVNSGWFQYDLVNNGDMKRGAYVIDTVGNAVTSNARMKVDGEETADYLYSLIEKAATNGFVYNDSQAGKMLFFEKAEALDWWFVDIQDYSFFYSSFQKMAVLFIGVALCFVLFCVGISIRFSKKIRKPLLQLVDKCRSAIEGGERYPDDELKYIDMAIAKMEHERYKNERHVKIQYIRTIILGEEMPFSISTDTMEALKKEYASPHYCVMLLKIQNLGEIPADKLAAELKIDRFTVCNLSEEIFAPVFTSKAVDVGEDLVGLLIMLESEQVPDEYVVCFKQLHEFVQKEIHLTVTGAMGMVVDSQKDVCVSYRKARQYLETGGIAGRDDLIDANSAAMVSYQEKNDKLVDSVTAYVELDFANPDLSLKSISQQFGLSTAYLGKIFKAVKGEAFSSYLTGYRLQFSQRELLETGKTVSEIAEEVGFTNSTYYSTVFKNAYGMTPSAFRGRRAK